MSLLISESPLTETVESLLSCLRSIQRRIRSLSSINDGAFCENSSRLLAVKYSLKTPS